MSVHFKTVKKALAKKKVKFTSKRSWEIFLKHGASHEEIKSVLEVCRELLVTDWHIYFPESKP